MDFQIFNNTKIFSVMSEKKRVLVKSNSTKVQMMLPFSALSVSIYAL